jgi:hypothetical protein
MQALVTLSVGDEPTIGYQPLSLLLQLVVQLPVEGQGNV